MEEPEEEASGRSVHIERLLRDCLCQLLLLP